MRKSLQLSDPRAAPTVHLKHRGTCLSKHDGVGPSFVGVKARMALPCKGGVVPSTRATCVSSRSQYVRRCWGEPQYRGRSVVSSRRSDMSISTASLAQRQALKGRGLLIKARGANLPPASRCVAEARPSVVPSQSPQFAVAHMLFTNLPLHMELR
eukprot:677462-Prorocentrum_minimum.AAC.2